MKFSLKHLFFLQLYLAIGLSAFGFARIGHPAQTTALALLAWVAGCGLLVFTTLNLAVWEFHNMHEEELEEIKQSSKRYLFFGGAFTLFAVVLQTISIIRL